jgi:hypothetical protein
MYYRRALGALLAKGGTGGKGGGRPLRWPAPVEVTYLCFAMI